MDAFDEKLAAILPKYPALWDKKNRYFRNKQTKNNCWREIGDTLGCTIDHAAARYKSLREKYRREKLIISGEYKSGTSPSQREQWPLFDTLSFLDKQIIPRKSSCSIKCTDPPDPLSQICEEPRDPNLENAEDISQMTEVEESADTFSEAEPETPEMNNLLAEDTQIPSTSRGNLSGQTTQTRKRGHNNSEVNAVLQRLADVAEKSVIKPTGAYYNFGQYVGQVLAELPEQEADLAVEDIMSVCLTKCEKEMQGAIIRLTFY